MSGKTLHHRMTSGYRRGLFSQSRDRFPSELQPDRPSMTLCLFLSFIRSHTPDSNQPQFTFVLALPNNYETYLSLSILVATVIVACRRPCDSDHRVLLHLTIVLLALSSTPLPPHGAIEIAMQEWRRMATQYPNGEQPFLRSSISLKR